MATYPPRDLRWGLIKQKANEVQAVKAVELLRKAGIEPILIKGVAAALNYSGGEEYRDSVDVDLAVPSSAVEKATQLIISPEAAGLAVDLHDGLRHLDPLPWDDLMKNSRLVPVEGGQIRVLRPEDHLRVLCVHWLTDGGSNYDRLSDIRFALENRPAKFDWERLLDVIDESRRRWILFAIFIARDEFSIDLSGTPLSDGVEPFREWAKKAVRDEWADATRFQPLGSSTSDWRSFTRQIRKRFPPNPITATILTNSSIDARSPLPAQIKTIIHRAGPSLKSLAKELSYKFR